MKFRGKSRRNIDVKGRLMLSPEFRSSLLLRMNMPPIQEDSALISEIKPDIIPPLEKPEIENTEIQFFITTYDDCLFAFPYHEWTAIEEEFSKITNSSASFRNFLRLFIGNAELHTVDSQGRILLSPDHREYADIGKEVFVVGQTERFEIWNPERYKKAIETQVIADVSEELRAGGINFPF